MYCEQLTWFGRTLPGREYCMRSTTSTSRPAIFRLKSRKSSLRLQIRLMSRRKKSTLKKNTRSDSENCRSKQTPCVLAKVRYRAITTILWCSGSGSTRKTGCKVYLVPSPCIADIRNRMRIIGKARMSFAHSLCDRTSCVLQGISFRAAGFFAVLALLAARSFAQSAAGPAPALREQQPAPAGKTDTAPKPRAKAKKVYTNDDLETRSAQVEDASSTETAVYAEL